MPPGASWAFRGSGRRFGRRSGADLEPGERGARCGAGGHRHDLRGRGAAHLFARLRRGACGCPGRRRRRLGRPGAARHGPAGIRPSRLAGLVRRRRGFRSGVSLPAIRQLPRRTRRGRCRAGCRHGLAPLHRAPSRNGRRCSAGGGVQGVRRTLRCGSDCKGTPPITRTVPKPCTTRTFRSAAASALFRSSISR